MQPVFDTIAESAARLCDAHFCTVFRFDGELIHFVAQHGWPTEAIDEERRAFPILPGRGSGRLAPSSAGALTQHSLDQAIVLTAFASIAMAALERGEEAVTLRRGLESNREIGKAIGLLMAMHSITDDQAFEMLSKVSQEMNISFSPRSPPRSSPTTARNQAREPSGRPDSRTHKAIPDPPFRGLVAAIVWPSLMRVQSKSSVKTAAFATVRRSPGDLSDTLPVAPASAARPVPRNQ